MIDVETADDVVVGTVRPERTSAKLRRQPGYAVIVEDDDFHTFDYVTDGLQKVCGHSRQKAFLLALEIDSRGQAIVWSGTLELAELKRDQIRGLGPDHFAPKPVTFPLGAYIEPLPD
jgi:ATP-dependent Clp protease adaptor protein ClpS